MAARRDMLNAIEKATRMESRLADIESPSIQDQMPSESLSSDYSEMDEWLLDNSDLSLSEIMSQLDDELDDEEKQVLMLLLDGVRETEAYVEVLGLGGLEKSKQQLEVKRAKDRLLKKLRRFGERIRIS